MPATAWPTTQYLTEFNSGIQPRAFLPNTTNQHLEPVDNRVLLEVRSTVTSNTSRVTSSSPPLTKRVRGSSAPSALEPLAHFGVLRNPLRVEKKNWLQRIFKNEVPTDDFYDFGSPDMEHLKVTTLETAFLPKHSTKTIAKATADAARDKLPEMMQRDSSIAKLSFMFGVTLISFCTPAVPKILDLVQPMNESRSRIVLYQTEFFIDQDKYYVELLFHSYVAVTIGNLRSREDAVKNAEVIMKKFSRCSEMQTEIFKFVKNLESSYNIALLVVVGVNIVTILLTGMTAIIKKSQPSEMIRMAFISAGGICHLFWISWLGHALEVQSEKIFTSALE
nr:PREDICTED: uncharacterized protein LOC105272665 [Fopius arisanus]